MNIFDAINSLARPQTFVDGLSGTWFAVGVGFVASLAFCILLVLTKSWHGALSMDGSEGIQKFHSTPTPRIGGLAILAALCVAWLNAPLELKPLIGMFLLAGLPAFFLDWQCSSCAASSDKPSSSTQRMLAWVSW